MFWTIDFCMLSSLVHVHVNASSRCPIHSRVLDFSYCQYYSYWLCISAAAQLYMRKNLGNPTMDVTFILTSVTPIPVWPKRTSF
uniref:Secreted protein n=1 Tax=Arundo donax TaxID=35708 RepID=A0A0A8ZWQ2_ARUDO